jgi:hypothetical protein
MTSAERPEADTLEQRQPVGPAGDEDLPDFDAVEADPADVADQHRGVDPDDEDMPDFDSVEADPADVADQHRGVDPDDEGDYPRA